MPVHGLFDRRTARLGVTLIELLVILSIIGLLIALIIPAVMSSRRAARQVHCTNNLRQLGVAVQNFQAAERHFPSGAPGVIMTIGGKSGVAVPREHSPLLQILGYIGEESIARAANFTLRYDFGSEAENTTIANTHLNIFVCPLETSSLLSAPTGPTSYRVNLGPGPYLPDMSQKPIGDYPGGGTGAFVFGRALTPSAFRDGLSNTAFVSEKLMGDNNPSVFSPSRDFWCAGLQGPDYPATDQLVEVCASVPSGVPPHVSVGGHSWYSLGFDTTFYNHTVTPNSRVAGCKIEGAQPTPDTSGNFGGVFGASSMHGGGVNVMTGDGAVRFVKDSINLAIWRALSTRAGGEPVPTY
jgi:type II secretory pathway pseudopilin PulG